MKKFFFLLIISLLFATSCNENNNVLVLKKKITYKVSGTATEMLITYVNENGETAMTGLSTVTIPWKIEFRAKADTYVYLQAKNTTALGDVKVEILQGNAVLFSDNNDLPYGAATCSGFVK